MTKNVNDVTFYRNVLGYYRQTLFMTEQSDQLKHNMPVLLATRAVN